MKENLQEEEKVKDEKKIEFDALEEDDDDTNRLLELLDHPWQLIKEGGQLGINGIKHFFSILFLFALSNAVLFIYAFVQLFFTRFTADKIPFMLLVLIIGLGFTLYSAYQTYQYVLIDLISVIYKRLSTLFHKISELIVDEVESLFDGKVDLDDNQLTQALNIGVLVHSEYGKLPLVVRNGIILILKKIPFVGMLLEVKDIILQGDKVKAYTELYDKMDVYISDNVFGTNNTKWVRWLLPVNIIILVVLIRLKLG